MEAVRKQCTDNVCDGVESIDVIDAAAKDDKAKRGGVSRTGFVAGVAAGGAVIVGLIIAIIQQAVSLKATAKPPLEMK